ncbi:uncharacterized protein Z520_01096 [Fonsecaea multimorphosa CBS 102226]|uniref:Peptide deformylase n=1 Tax=Fonsecaea multimorphosa CBS 102226 TaxID=1442371 RepID=A0A0D2HL35_9EURO|nr:uncharacterized protein Z520_01096 [Fonsecaea multimorphosa CBS 102226]KIY02631.1 hypothetical protein Z520_01096 [Fonsecaea multimorphosa CBS 102226]OAL31494.1 hypothetical protein AYO22_01086 [Fonsecaea multimorphosa]
MSSSQPDPRQGGDGGKVLAIVRWGTPILHRELRPVTAFNTQELDALVADMFATMYAAGGVGLAANQIGVDLRVFVYDMDDARGQRRWGAVCNPVIEPSSQKPFCDDGGSNDNNDHQHQSNGAGGAAIHPPQVPQRTGSMTEGCLSYPGISASVSRLGTITINGLDPRGEPVTIHATGLFGHVLQHEVDHLNGIVYGDRVSLNRRDEMDRKYRELEAKRAYPDDWPATQSSHKWGD